MLDVVREPFGDRRVADLGVALAAVHVAVARVEDGQEAFDLLIPQAEHRIGNELLP